MDGFLSPARSAMGLNNLRLAQQAQVKAQRRLAEQLEQLTLRFGFRHFLLTTFPEADKADFDDNHIVSTWSERLRNWYDGTDAFRRSRLVTRLKTTIVPIFLTDGAFAKADEPAAASPAFSVFAEEGLCHTFGIVLQDAQRQQYIVAFSGERTAPTTPESREILFDSLQLLDAYARESMIEAGPQERLSSREIECLRWSAAGKSSEEIAIILELSAHTVASYLKGAMRKLDAVNRMQAVARACRYRLL